MVKSNDLPVLAAAPASTKPDLEEGYDPNILSGKTQTPHQSSTLLVDKEGHPTRSPPSSKPPFWRTTKGIVIISLEALIIIGAIVGGAVGSTVGRSGSNNNSLATQEGGDDSSSPSFGSSSDDFGDELSEIEASRAPAISEEGGQATGGAGGEATRGAAGEVTGGAGGEATRATEGFPLPTALIDGWSDVAESAVDDLGF